MRNRPTFLVAGLALSLVVLSTALLLAHPLQQSPSTKPQWQITRFENGQPTGAIAESEIPQNLDAAFPAPARGSTVVYRIETIPNSSAPSHAGWFSRRRLSPDDLRTIEFLLLLPPATLLVCVFRNVVGLPSFGTFAPALLGLAFREVQSPLGIFVVLTIITAGWWLRRALNELHLLQVPRTALLLSCVVVMLLILIGATGGSGSRTITLFPLVILTGMIERFWSMEEEGSASSIGTLAATLFMAGCVWLFAVIPAVPAWMLAHPETLGFVMASQILLGRYTGFRLVELYRFRALMNDPEPNQAG